MSSTETNYLKVRERMRSACLRVGRAADDCRLIVAGKYAAPDQIETVLELGHRDLGENRVQEAEKKIAFFLKKYPDVSWHLIGHLQTNKVKKLIIHKP